MTPVDVSVPFLFVNPKSYLYGRESLELARAADRISEQYGLTIFYTCPYADLRLIAGETRHIVVTAQNMDALSPGRGMGAVLPESLAEAGARAVVLNHAECPKTLAQLTACVRRAHALGLLSIVCADSAEEAGAAAVLGADVVLAEPTRLIGTGTAAGVDYIQESVRAVRRAAPHVKVMIASGITVPMDAYRVVFSGADGTGSTSGIVKAPDPPLRLEEMAKAVLQAARDRNN